MNELVEQILKLLQELADQKRIDIIYDSNTLSISSVELRRNNDGVISGYSLFVG